MISKVVKVILFFLMLSQLLVAGVSYAAKSQEIMNQIKTFGEASGTETAKPPQQFIAELIQVVLATVGVVFLLLLVYGGFQLITAAGEEEKAKKAMGIIQAAIIGLAIILSAWAITYFVATKFSAAVTEGLNPAL